ncbi:MAG TPA: lysostaphin resistance A-like protein, partial [Vicinamibacterales bacterium]
MKRPAFWILLALASLVAVLVGFRFFPQAFSIVALDITMDRDRALADARRIVERDHLGPSGYRQAASFTLDDEAQTFVELEGGGKDAFTTMMRDGLYSAYTWQVRHFREGETNEVTVRFTPDGRPYGFVEKLREETPGPALDAPAARRIAEAGATSRWNVALPVYGLVEQGQERRTGGRVDHTFTYERSRPTLNDGRYRLRLVVSGDRLTEVTYFLKIPEAFSRRYESMRSANDAIGIGSVVGMALLYVFGGIGVGLFFMLRQKWVLWRAPVVWGFSVSLFQTLATLNEFPLLWMTYDTALPRSTFLAQEMAKVVAAFVGFGVFYALSFMAAETLTRRAFGSHPQFWRVWARTSAQSPTRPGRSASGPASSYEILGRTTGAYLLVAIFFAYDVLLYLVATKTLGWWSPSEALLHPDVLATYAPWLSAIGNSFQAGFWEESLFRAVPIAGAALIGDRFGNRRLFIVIAFVIQALIFGAGHAPYPNQPAYARPVELILPSIGFGLLYLYFGLLPGIILHFTFDVVWFALPIFLASAPGVWLQKLMVVVMTLVPLWVILFRRVQAGSWHELSPLDRNAAWTPPRTVPEPFVPDAPRPLTTLGARGRMAWLVLGAAGVIAVAIGAIGQSSRDSLPITRQQAADIARRTLTERGFTLGPRWRVMPVPDDGGGGAGEFVSETAGEARRRSLLGSYLPKPRWNVRVATFEGDVVDRAEEWRVSVSDTGEVRMVQHTLPEGRPGASLDEPVARALAVATLQKRYGLDAARGQAREVSAHPQKLKARTDWTFTYVDTTVPPLPQGEPRIEITLAGDEVAASGRFVYVPEEWRRQERAAATRNTVLQVLVSVLFGGLLVGAAVSGVIAWSRRQYT